MKSLTLISAFSILLFLLPTLSCAETIRLKDGTQLEGTIGAWNADGTEFYFNPKRGANDADEPFWIEMSNVEGIRYEGVVVKETVGKKVSAPS